MSASPPQGIKKRGAAQAPPFPAAEAARAARTKAAMQKPMPRRGGGERLTQKLLRKTDAPSRRRQGFVRRTESPQNREYPRRKCGGGTLSHHYIGSRKNTLNLPAVCSAYFTVNTVPSSLSVYVLTRSANDLPLAETCWLTTSVKVSVFPLKVYFATKVSMQVSL